VTLQYDLETRHDCNVTSGGLIPDKNILNQGKQSTPMSFLFGNSLHEWRRTPKECAVQYNAVFEFSTIKGTILPKLAETPLHFPSTVFSTEVMKQSWSEFTTSFTLPSDLV
jgi:hypothetical protein